MFPFGSKDNVDLLGYIIERCPTCDTTGVFSLYEASKKLTVYLVPTVTLGREQQVLECRACQAKFAVPDDLRATLGSRLMTQEQLAARVREMRARPATALASPTRRTFYQVLQVDPDAEQEVVEAAFKRLALKYHPDRSTRPDADERMRELIEAHDVLADGRKRLAYDRSIGIVRRPPRAPALRPEEV